MNQWTDFHEIWNQNISHEIKSSNTPITVVRRNPIWRRPPSWNSKMCCNFWTNGRIFMKFEIRIYLTETKHKKQFISLQDKIQDGGGRNLEIRRSAVTFEPVNGISRNLKSEYLSRNQIIQKPINALRRNPRWRRPSSCNSKKCCNF